MVYNLFIRIFDKIRETEEIGLEQQDIKSKTLRNHIRLLLFFWSGILLLFVLIFCFSSVREIKIVGNSNYIYTDEELRLGCHLSIGQRLYSVNEAEVEQEMKKSFPTIESITVDKCGFFGIIIEIKEKLPCYYIQQGASYYSLSYDFYVLERSDHAPSLLRINAREVKEGFVGKQIVFEDIPNQEYYVGAKYNEEMATFLSELQKAPFYSQLTTVDITSITGLQATLGDSLTLIFGNNENTRAKCDAIQSILTTTDVSLLKKINVSTPEKPVAIPK